MMRQDSKGIMVAMLLIATNIHYSHGYQQIKEPSCHLYDTNTCKFKTKSFCTWNEQTSTCINNGEQQSIFLSTYDISPLSHYFWFIVIGWFCYFLREIFAKTLIINNKRLGWFNNVDAVRKAKCITYCSEFILTSISFIILCESGAITIIWDPQSFEEMDSYEMKPKIHMMNFCFLTVNIMYIIEMIADNDTMRTTLKMHHFSTNLTYLLFAMACNERLDIDTVRFGVTLSMYVFLESNVFIQLMLYRINPNKYASFHIISTSVYIITRILVFITFIFVYIDWINSTFVQNELFANGEYFFYKISFIFIPIENLVLNISQFASSQALIYITKRVIINSKIRKELSSDPRMQQLHDIWIRFDESENGYMEFDEFHQFVAWILNDLIIQKTTLELLWESLGYKQDSKMKWSDFCHLFKPSIKSNVDYSVSNVIADKLQQLLTMTIKVEQFIENSLDQGNNEKNTFIKILRKNTKVVMEIEDKTSSNSNKSKCLKMFCCKSNNNNGKSEPLSINEAISNFQQSIKNNPRHVFKELISYSI